jgi:hypothetical protein
MADPINENNGSNNTFDLNNYFKMLICLNDIDQRLIEIFLVKNRKRASNVVFNFANLLFFIIFTRGAWR